MKKPFNVMQSVLDEESYGNPKVKQQRAQLDPETGLLTVNPAAGRYVPVSFVAKDWNVTPRRIRALLMDGRLQGRQLPNGYWEVGYPYKYVFGTRGPSLKRQQRPPKRSKPTKEKPELRAV